MTRVWETEDSYFRAEKPGTHHLQRVVKVNVTSGTSCVPQPMGHKGYITSVAPFPKITSSGYP